MKRATAVELLCTDPATPWSEAQRTIADMLGLSRSWVMRWPDGELPREASNAVVAACVRMWTMARIAEGRRFTPAELDAAGLVANDEETATNAA